MQPAMTLMVRAKACKQRGQEKLHDSYPMDKAIRQLPTQ